MTTRHVGSTLESLFDELGERDELEVGIAKKVLAHRAVELMKRAGVIPTRLAKRMGTSRTVVYRLLDEEDTGVTLETMVRAARALGCSLAELLGLAPMPSAARMRQPTIPPKAPAARSKRVRARAPAAAYTGGRRAKKGARPDR